MIRLAIFIYGIVVLFRGKFALGKGKEVVGTRARILGLIWVCEFPFTFLIGVALGLLAANGVIELPGPGAMLVLEIGILLAAIVLVFVLGHSFYRQQQEEERYDMSTEPVPPQDTGPEYSIIDPDNPYASPTNKF